LDRNLTALVEHEFDLLVIGGGIFGACAARDAAMRGLSVALIEREDFASGVSANSFKMVHGGIRYLQHLDIARLRESCFERSAFLRIAPHLVNPLPIVVPTFGMARESKWFLALGMVVYDLLTFDRNRGITSTGRRIPGATTISRDEVINLFPGLADERLTGAALFNDAQMYNPTRLVLAFVQSAAADNAVVANYVEAVDLLVKGDQVSGAKVTDRLAGDEFNVRAKCVLNAAGPWSQQIWKAVKNRHVPKPGVFSRDACFLIPRRFRHGKALAVPGQTKDPDAILSRSARHLFVVPWRDYTLVGVWHVVFPGHPDTVDVPARDLESFIAEINGSYPELDIRLSEVTMWNAGLVPFGEDQTGGDDLSYGKRSRLVDHERESGLAGLVTLVGIRYTMGRGDAKRAVDMVTRKLGKRVAPAPTHRVPVHGGDILDFDQAMHRLLQERPGEISEACLRALFRNYGTEYAAVLEQASQNSALKIPLAGTTVLAAEVLHGIRREMAMTLADIVFRRTDLATGGHPGNSVLRQVAELAAAEFGWSAQKVTDEIEKVCRRFPKLGNSLPDNIKQREANG
jgi:glycerol-3-phosphate dehydrogenase